MPKSHRPYQGIELEAADEVVGEDTELLPSTVGAVEEIKLEVLGTLVADVLAVDHHSQVEVPLAGVEGAEEAGYLRAHRQPALPVGRKLLHGQPAPVVGLDGIGTPPSGQQRNTARWQKPAYMRNSKGADGRT